ncbi:ABC transporter permease [Paraburkholderia susongensis]|uniref:Capsular polysaccharide transport system permease protein n=1 Tax=Paraburkholderia susongensis TaxID=1515439 RepID=A0A1X7LRN6_9BURK|nr:ABC transporter permease [Paraburkholderia susongensis]SMG56531.1 capsular polysaccharide transport system permease protein [Paraburkholderia susongensis]
MTGRSRTPLEVTISVWWAMFLREALDRLFEARAAWLWLLLEPIVYIALHAFGFETFRIHQVGGLAINMWIVAGFIGFLLWRRTWMQVLHGVDCNKAFFAYRQVKPFDAAIVRAVLEIFLMVPVSIVMFSIVLGFGHGMTQNTQNPIWLPQDPLLVIASVLGLWLLGLGFGLVTSVLMSYVREVDHIFKMLYLPLYYISGALMPISMYIPLPYQYIFVANPIVNGVEMMRLGFLPEYHVLKGVSLEYLYAWALGLLLLGLALYKRFSRKLVML